MNTPNTTAPSRIELPGGWYITIEKNNIAEDTVRLYDPNECELMDGFMMEPERFAAAMNATAPQQAPVRPQDVREAIVELCMPTDGTPIGIKNYNKMANTIMQYIATLEAQPPAHSPVNTALPAGLREALESTVQFLALEDFAESEEDHHQKLMKVLKQARAALTQPVSAPSLTAAQEIVAERQRQKDMEGWTPEHDDTHNNWEMAAAAACYAFMASKDDQVRSLAKAMSHPHELGNDPERRLIALRFWPWSWSWFKLKDRRRDLVRAGALILAEIERLDRAALSANGKDATQAANDNQKENATDA